MNKKERILSMNAYFYSKVFFGIAWHSYRLCDCMKDFKIDEITRKTIIPCRHLRKATEKSYNIFLNKIDSEYKKL